MTNSSDLSPFTPLVAAVRQGRVFEVLPSVMAEAFANCSFALFLFRPDRAPICLVDNLGEEKRKAVIDPYIDGMYLMDPLYHHAIRFPQDCLVTLDQLMPEGFRHSDYYRHYYASIALQDEFMLCYSLDSVVLVISLGFYGCRGPRGLKQQLSHVQPLLGAFIKEAAGNLVLADVSESVPELLGELEGQEALSPREQQVAQLILRGFAGKAIARQLNISPETVKIHRRHLYRKLGVASQAELFGRFLKSRGFAPL